ncbi:S24 family peptidase [Arachidicoccus sp.]|uniref:S24 family peptidase n=1 Tax=Arachidicoccus sp. TaxID=1872624 RepID=UPI003D1DC2D1
MKNKSPIKQRILQYITENGISKYQFYKDTGITRGILDQDNGITESNIERFLACFKSVNPSWLILGSGDMLLDNRKPRETIIDPQPSITTLPLIPPESLEEYFDGDFTTKDAPYQRYVVPVFIDAEFLLNVRDVSMYPKFNIGDIVACKRIKPPTFIQWNKIYMLNTVQGVLIKRVTEGADDNHFKIVSDNKTYKAFQIHRSEIKAMAIVRGVIHVE